MKSAQILNELINPACDTNRQENGGGKAISKFALHDRLHSASSTSE